MLVRQPEWTREAACADLVTAGRDPWSPDDESPATERAFELHLARRICAGCPVRLECLNDELARLPVSDPWSMRGGLTPKELVGFARSHGMPYRRVAQHGTRSRYVGGCRCDECRNAHRVYEHERRLRAGGPRRATADPGVPDAWLTLPIGHGRHRAEPGQLLLFTDGLPPHYVAGVD